MLTRIRKFSAGNRLKKEAIKIIAAGLPTDEISGLREMFLDIDQDKSGAITAEEFANVSTHMHALATAKRMWCVCVCMPYARMYAYNIHTYSPPITSTPTTYTPSIDRIRIITFIVTVQGGNPDKALTLKPLGGI